MKGAIFDLDGTLIDSMGSWGHLWEVILAEHHIPQPEDFIRTITPLGLLGVAKYMQEMGVKMPTEEMLEMYETRISPAYAHHIPAKAGVAAYLHKLKAEGVRLCVLTASSHPLLDPCLKRLGLWELFDFVWSCDDFGMKKSDPAIYPHTAAALGVPLSDVVFFDDNVVALTAAREAGVYTVGVYDDTSATDRPQIERIVDRYIESFEELT